MQIVIRIKPELAPSTPLPEMTVVGDPAPISTEQLNRDIEEMMLEDDLRQIRLGGED